MYRDGRASLASTKNRDESHAESATDWELVGSSVSEKELICLCSAIDSLEAAYAFIIASSQTSDRT